jgi:dTDP-4-dehydrorhamnose reductase
MNRYGAFLIVGADSLVGGGVLRALERRGHLVFSSTRRRSTVSGRRIYLDYDDPDVPALPSQIDYVFLIAAATNYARCESDPAAWRTNVESIPRVATALLQRGLFVTFISTNSVFGGERPWPNEDDPQAPGIAYARHKAEGESAIRAASKRLGSEDRLNIVRLTKILSRETSPLPAWFAAWEHGQAVHPFSDLIFAPISVRFVGDALATIGEKRLSGSLHLSGADNVNYVDLANILAMRMAVPSDLIAPTTSTEKGVNILFKPRYSGIGMRCTSQLTGITPQQLDDVARDLTGDKGE